MAEKDISDLMCGLDLNSTKQPNIYTSLHSGSYTDEAKPHKIRRRQLYRQIADDEEASTQQNRKPSSSTRMNERALKANKTAKLREQPSPPKAEPPSGPNARVRRASKKSLAADSLSSKSQPSHIYIVQVMRPSEAIEGAFSSVVDANNRALDYLESKFNIRADEISGQRGLFGQATSAVKATKRIWQPTGNLEILTPSGTPWIRVLKKPVHLCQPRAGEKTVYLSLDRSDGIFVIGAYQCQDEAWEGCKKYWSDLSVCASISDLKDWYEGGFHHAQARIAGKLHRWSLKSHTLL
ncbi:hypothetical protein Asppvi_009993 [Aspergillus pseudoviridinutans]|uniref:Uncharacterized protein n=1 Tax=Aspergillus pseudoviridinutans TaxID=1517512 RepID=A0A9P3EZI3_9EURO|nr:uncharacterized protein Asppvi_009993 [Aspergillus pseudoviridinutans]GIJ91028.1 hypothetical protein Asppvi_009993 [Aspergillus pseudoviridinutans]